MSNLDSLLAPISEECPCGDDISDTPEILELDTLILGKAETQFSEAVKPDWKLVQERCLSLLERSKHLSVLTVYTLASLQIDGIPACAQSLDLLSNLVRRYWATLYPSLDPSDNNDPLERMNILGALAQPEGSFGDNFRFLQRLSEAPLTNSPLLGRLSYREVKGSDDPAATGQAVDPAQVQAAFRDTPPEYLAELHSGLALAISAVDQMAAFLDQIDGANRGPSFAPLRQHLVAIRKEVDPFVEVPTVVGEDGVPVEGAPGGDRRGGLANTISTREDVIAALDRICGYYSSHEPSSPVPLLLKRARRLVHMEFLDIVADLAPDAVTQLQNVTGLRKEGQ